MGKAKKQGSRQGVFGTIWERFGDVAKRLGLVGDSDVQEALDAQLTMPPPRKRIGEILVEGGKLSKDHVDQVLKHQVGATKPAGAKKSAAKKPAAKKPAAKRAAKKKAPKKKK